MKKKVNEFKRAAFENFITNIDYKKDSKKLYNFVSTLTNKYQREKKQPILVGDKQLTEDKEIAESFGSFFAGKLRKTRDMKIRERAIKRDMIPTFAGIDYEICNKDFTMEELIYAIEKQKTGKSPGPDEI